MLETDLYERIIKTNKPWRADQVIAKEFNLVAGNRVVGVTVFADLIALYNAGLRIVKVELESGNLSLYFVICDDDNEYNLLRMIAGDQNIGLCHQL